MRRQPLGAQLQRDAERAEPSSSEVRVCLHGQERIMAEHRRNHVSKMARSMLRGIRVASKQQLIDRIHQYFEEINADPIIFRWKYKMDEIGIG